MALDLVDFALRINQHFDNWVNDNFHSGSEPVDVVNALTTFIDIADLVVQAEISIHNYFFNPNPVARAALSATLQPLANHLGVVGLSGSITADILRINHAIDQGDHQLSLDLTARLMAGVYGAVLGGGALALLLPGAPILPFLPLLYMGGQIIFDNRDDIGAVIGKIGDIIGDLVGYLTDFDGAVAADLADIGDIFDSPLLNIVRDPLILDLDGDGIELSSLANSTVHFDYDGDGFAERTGWVSADDGILTIDANANGAVDGAAELFGSPTQDGFAVLELYDSNGDGKIDANDAAWAQLRVWQDADQDGVSDAGELKTLADAGVKSINLTRDDVAGTNQGHVVGYEALFTRNDGTSGSAQTIYFEVDRQDTRADNTPSFTPAEGVDKLPQLAGSGQINSIAWKASNDATFMADWTDLTDDAATLTRDELRARFENMMLRWAGVEGTATGSRGYHVDAAHLAFVEKFFGTSYREVGRNTATSPTNETFGARIEASFDQVVDVMLTAFLSQVTPSLVARDGGIAAAMGSPYVSLLLIDYRNEFPSGEMPPETPGNIGAVLEVMAGLAPAGAGSAARYLEAALSGLDGAASVFFQGDRAAYLTVAQPVLLTIGDSELRLLATEIVKGDAALGSTGTDGLLRQEGDNVFIAGKGDDVLVSGDGSDLFVYAQGDGADYIRDSSKSLTETDTLFLTDLTANDVVFERYGSSLVVKVTTGAGGTITVEDFFAGWGAANRGVDQVRFSDGSTFDREAIRARTITVGDDNSNLLKDTAGNDVLHGGNGHDTIEIGTGNDTILYAAGDGFDTIVDNSGLKAENDRLVLVGLLPSDVELSRYGDRLTIKVLSTGEVLTDQRFFENSSSPNAPDGWNNHGSGIDTIQFANGLVWDRQTIQSLAWLRGDNRANAISGSGLSETLQGGAGRDAMEGLGGSDTYVWTPGDGSDAIIENGSTTSFDKLVLTGLAQHDVRFDRQGDDLLITVIDTEEVIRVVDQFRDLSRLTAEGTHGYGVEWIQFSDGQDSSRQEIANKAAGLNSPGKISEVYSGFSPQYGIQYWYYEDEFGGGGDIYEFGMPDHVRTYYKQGHDIVYGFGQNDWITPGGLPWPVNFAGDNLLDGKDGNDTLVGGYGEDTLIGGKGDDLLFGGMLNTDDEDEDELGHDLLYGDEGNDVLYGGAGDDYLKGGSGSDQLYGGNGDDQLSEGEYGDDLFVGGRGDDTINSGHNFGSGSDTFIYRYGDGNDVISDPTYSWNEATIDTLILKGISQSDIDVYNFDDDLILKFRSTGQTITVIDQFDRTLDVPHIGMEIIRFDDGTEWNRSTIYQKASMYRGTDARESIFLNPDQDSTVQALKGDDIITSGYNFASGNDTFIYRAGDGNDVISDPTYNAAQTDTLVLTDLLPQDVELTRAGKNLAIRIKSTDEVITIVDQTFVGAGGVGLELIRFADGTEWNRAQMHANAWYRGSPTGDSIFMEIDADNTVIAGKGDDVITSGYNYSSGNDTFIYASGDGNDVISDPTTSSSQTDRLVLTDLNFSDVKLERVQANLVITVLATAETIRVIDQFKSSTGPGLEVIRFANGTEFSREDIRYWTHEGSHFYQGTSSAETLIGSHFDQTIGGGGGNDFIDGKGGSDTLYGDDGNDTLALSVSVAGELDALDGGVGTDKVTFAGFGSGILVDLVENQGEAKIRDDLRLVATLRSLEDVVGTAFHDDIAGDAANNRLSGGAGNDALSGRSGNDTLTGGTGDDILNGYLGNDIYEYTLGDGHDAIIESAIEAGSSDRLRLYGVDPAQIVLSRQDGKLLVGIRDIVTGVSLGSVTVEGPQVGTYHYDEYGIENIEFDGGVVWNKDVLRQMSVFDSATDGDDVLVGSAASGLMQGRKGNDTLDGGAGNDTYLYTRGDGNDTITEGSSAGTDDRLVFTGINPADVTVFRNGNHLTLVIAESTSGAGDGAEIVLKDNVDGSNGRGVDKVVFPDTTTWTRADLVARVVAFAGTSGNDTVTGTTAADSILAGRGNDTLVGLAGNDTYTYRSGDGNDVVTEVASGTDVDVLTFADINQADVRFERPFTDLTDVVIRVLATGATITLDNQFDQEGGVEKIVFADGSFLGGNDWSLDGVLSGLVTIYGTSGNDTIYGSTTANDTLDGGLGDDYLAGEEGSDTYLYRAGDGNDLVNEKATGTDKDTLKLLGLNQADVRFERPFLDLTDVIVRVLATGETFTLDNQYDQEDGVEKIVFADGTTLGGNDWSLDGILNGLVVIYGTSGNDTIYGSTTSNDTLDGGLGDDYLAGEDGSDTYLYRAGDGNDLVNEKATGTDKDTLKLLGLNPADIEILRPAADMTDIVIRLKATGETFTLDNQFDQEDGVEKIIFADGTVWGGDNWSLDGLLASLASIVGTSGNDTIVGTSSGDRLVGGTGNDTLTGGAGSDLFAFTPGFGHDVITDFKAGAASDDKLLLDGTLFADFNAVLAAAAQVGADTVITYDAANTITLKAVGLANLHADDVGFI